MDVKAIILSLLLLTKSELECELVTTASFEQEGSSRKLEHTAPHVYRQEAIGEEVKIHKD